MDMEKGHIANERTKHTSSSLDDSLISNSVGSSDFESDFGDARSVVPR